MNVHELREHRSKIVARIKELDLKLQAAKNHYRTSGQMSNLAYKQLCDNQHRLSEEKCKLEAQLPGIKTTIREFEDVEFVANGASPKNKETTQSLVDLRLKYQQFAADGTRVSSMRKMAAEFVLELNIIIKHSIRS